MARKALLLLLFFTCTIALWAADNAKTNAPPDGPSVGDETCASCHDAQATRIKTNVHGQLKAYGKGGGMARASIGRWRFAG